MANPTNDTIFSDREIEALQFAHDLYGGMAKQRGLDLAGALDLPPEAAGSFVVALAAQIDSIDDFQERKALAEHIGAAVDLLGRDTASQTLQIVPVVELSVEVKKDDVVEKSPVSVAEPEEPVEPAPVEVIVEPVEEAPTLETDPAITDDPHEAGTNNDELSESEILSRVQETILIKIFGAQVVGRNITVAQGRQLLGKVSEQYGVIPVKKRTDMPKSIRCEQLMARFNGAGFTELAKLYDSSVGSISQSLNKALPDSIKRGLGKETLMEILQKTLAEDESVETDAVEPDVAEVIPVPDDNIDVVDEPADKPELTRSQENLLIKIFGEKIARLSLDAAQGQQLLADVLKVYGAIPTKTGNAIPRADRCEQLMARYMGESYYDISTRYDTNTRALEVAMSDLPKAIKDNITTEELDKILANGREESTVTANIDEEIVEAPVASVTPEVISPKPEPKVPRTNEKLVTAESLPEAVELLAQTLKITAAKEFDDLKAIFNNSVLDSFKGKDIAELRDDIRSLVEFMAADPLVHPDIQLDELEMTVLYSLLGLPDKALPPLSVKSTKGRYSKQLAAAHRNIENVLTVALAKVYSARKVNE
ncbi:MAG: hypothetical protein ABIQ89_01305 [Candidatus Saccharimonadales bacterium]